MAAYIQTMHVFVICKKVFQGAYQIYYLVYYNSKRFWETDNTIDTGFLPKVSSTKMLVVIIIFNKKHFCRKLSRLPSLLREWGIWLCVSIPYFEFSVVFEPCYVTFSFHISLKKMKILQNNCLIFHDLHLKIKFLK